MNFTANQLRAVTEPGNLLVVAAAGAGKTGTLVERCIRLLLRPENPVSIRRILVVTFTEAAAAEVRERIRRELEKAATANPTNEEIQDQVANIDSAHISTLHSFCFELIRRNVLSLEIDPAVSVLEPHQSRVLFLNTLDLLLEEHYAERHDFSPDLKEIIRSHFGGWEKPLKQFVERLHEFTQTRPGPETWFEQALVRFESEERPEWHASYAEALQEWCLWWLPCLERLPKENLNGHACAELMRKAITLGDAEIAAKILERNQCWPKGKATAHRDEIKDLFDEAEFLASLLPKPGQPHPLDEDWEWMRRPLLVVLRFAQQFAQRFGEEKRERGVVDFHDLEQLSLRLLIDPKTGQPTETAREWQEKFQAVFVDEYQDINAAQDLILSAVSSREIPGNRFLVGDVKQSIYRFRQADPRIFRQYLASPGWTTIPLSENFRSHEGLLHFVNPLFRWLMQRDIGGLVYDSSAELRFGNAAGRSAMSCSAEATPPVELHLMLTDQEAETPAEDEAGDTEKPELEARLVAARLRALKEGGFMIYHQREGRTRPVEWKDMVVLLRAAKSRVEVYAKAFAEAGVPLQTKRDAFFATQEVLDLANVLHILDNPRQDIPLAGVLRSPMVGLTADEIALVRVQSSLKPFWTALNDVVERKLPSGTPKIEKFLRLYHQWRHARRCSSLAQRLEAILVDTGYGDWLLSQPRGRERYANVQQLLRIARQFDESRGESLYLFLRHIEELEDAVGDIEPATSVEENAVRLMTVHQSKGLEFPVVAVADLGKQFNNSDRAESLLIHGEHGLCSMIKPPHTGQRYPSLPLWLARRSEHREAAGEEMRILYVALTRAQNHLLLFGTGTNKRMDKWRERAHIHPLPQHVLRHHSWLDWIGTFANQQIPGALGEESGRNELFSYRIHLPPSSNPPAVQSPVPEIDVSALNLKPPYLHAAATRAKAKTSVTAVRRMASQDEEAAPLPVRMKRERRGAERGLAVHTFLELFSLSEATMELTLRAEARRLVQDRRLTPEQISHIDFEAICHFWTSEIGTALLRKPSELKRELPFTFKVRNADLTAAGLASQLLIPKEEFVLIQGIADLVLITSSEIWLIDFKTDQLGPGEFKPAVERYRAQILLYAIALRGIFGRPVTKKGIFFLEARRFAWF